MVARFLTAAILLVLVGYVVIALDALYHFVLETTVGHWVGFGFVTFVLMMATLGDEKTLPHREIRES